MQIRWWTAGDPADRAFDKNVNDVYDFAIRALRDPNRAADVVLETMTRVRRDLRAGRIPDDVKAHSFTVAASVLINELHDLLHIAPFAACMAEKQPVARWSHLARVPKPGEERAERERAARAAWSEIGRLPPEDYAIVALHLKHDLSIDYVARALRGRTDSVRERVRAVTQRFDRSVRLRVVEERGRSRCAGLRAELARVADDADDEPRLAVVEQHAAGCDRCGPEFARTAGAASVVKDFALVPASNCVKKEIRDRVNRAIEDHAPSRLRAPLRLALALLTGTALVGSGTAAVIRLSNEPTPVVSPRSEARQNGEPRAGSPTATFSPRAGTRTAIAAPAKPSVTVTLQPPAAITVAWNQPANNGAAITGYVIQRAVRTGPFVEIATTIARTFQNRVTPGAYYRYRVAAVNAAGRGAFSEVKAVVVPGTLSTSPLGLTAVASNCHVVLAWSPPESSGSGMLKGYTVTRVDSIGNTTTLTPTPITATSYDDVWDSNTGVYTYRVAAVTSVGTGPAALSQPRTLDCVPQ